MTISAGSNTQSALRAGLSLVYSDLVLWAAEYYSPLLFLHLSISPSKVNTNATFWTEAILGPGPKGASKCGGLRKFWSFEFGIK